MNLGPLADYLAARELDRHVAVDRALAALTPKEQLLVREAAVMGYVRGVMNAPYRDHIPPDSDVVREVVDACLAMPDLYPTINGDDNGQMVGPELERTDQPPGLQGTGADRNEVPVLPPRDPR